MVTFKSAMYSGVAFLTSSSTTSRTFVRLPAENVWKHAIVATDLRIFGGDGNFGAGLAFRISGCLSIGRFFRLGDGDRHLPTSSKLDREPFTFTSSAAKNSPSCVVEPFVEREASPLAPPSWTEGSLSRLRCWDFKGLQGGCDMLLFLGSAPFLNALM